MKETYYVTQTVARKFLREVDIDESFKLRIRCYNKIKKRYKNIQYITEQQINPLDSFDTKYALKFKANKRLWFKIYSFFKTK